MQAVGAESDGGSTESIRYLIKQTSQSLSKVFEVPLLSFKSYILYIAHTSMQELSLKVIAILYMEYS